jgi:hypothetical protein
MRHPAAYDRRARNGHIPCRPLLRPSSLHHSSNSNMAHRKHACRPVNETIRGKTPLSPRPAASLTSVTDFTLVRFVMVTPTVDWRADRPTLSAVSPMPTIDCQRGDLPRPQRPGNVTPPPSEKPRAIGVLWRLLAITAAAMRARPRTSVDGSWFCPTRFMAAQMPAEFPQPGENGPARM